MTQKGGNIMNLRNYSMAGALTAFLAAGALLLPATTPVFAADEDVEVLTRGPVHEAFAETVSLDPVAGMIVQVAPPEAIEEMPPEHQLEGDNVTWIPGYWAWDDERNDYLWISGIWRNLPPGRQSVPGYWNTIGDGQYQWTSGYWADSRTSEVSYIATAPPRSLDVGPNVAAPSDDYSWAPGSWYWSDSRYLWRPGYWVMYRPNWTWMPSRYCWTRHGYVYVDGYWDYAVARRGVLFAPVYYRNHVYATPGYYYTPAIVVALSVFADHLFISPRHSHYYFGDYYAPRYRDSGYFVSYSYHTSRGGYDPIYAYERWDHRRDSGWEERRRRDYDYFRDNEAARPPRTWAAMREVQQDRFNDGRNRAFATTLAVAAEKPVAGQRFRTLDKKNREKFVTQSREMTKFSGERRQLETRAAVTGEAAGKTAVREKFTRSPIKGLQADRFAKGEAPPKRPEARVMEPRTSPEGGKAGDRNAETSPQRRAEGESQRKGRPEGAPQRETEAAPQRKAEGVPQRETEAAPQGKGKSPQRETEAAPQRKAEGVPQREPEAAPQRKGKSQQRGTDAVPQRESQQTPQRKAEAAPQREAQQQPQVREAPQRKAQPAPQREAQQQPQVREVPQRKAQPAPQREAQQQPQVREAPQRKAQPAPQREVQQQPQVREAPQRKAQPAPQRQVQQQPQVREAPQRRAQPAPQREAQAAPQRNAQAAPQSGARSGQKSHKGSEEEDPEKKK
jgi:hypothetical protein